MAKGNVIKIKLASTADTGYFYVTKKNSRTKTDKLSFKKYDPWRASTSSSRKPRSSNLGHPRFGTKRHRPRRCLSRF